MKMNMAGIPISRKSKGKGKISKKVRKNSSVLGKDVVR